MYLLSILDYYLPKVEPALTCRHLRTYSSQFTGKFTKIWLRIAEPYNNKTI